ncbi:hypothetical protein LX32DRAFT_66263 [Colletotrichum zoysiae]|uniref:Secreted protein n=1 Tax=Colletotrichum zoysiae TaxID=1216348 RepID=A0AAD9HA48_9PEZI|nr:hypothetical protein LX32DRAFT_66263 [Colletotrichum zoysiae]
MGTFLLSLLLSFRLPRRGERAGLPSVTGAAAMDAFMKRTAFRARDAPPDASAVEPTTSEKQAGTRGASVSYRAGGGSVLGFFGGPGRPMTSYRCPNPLVAVDSGEAALGPGVGKMFSCETFLQLEFPISLSRPVPFGVWPGG